MRTSVPAKVSLPETQRPPALIVRSSVRPSTSSALRKAPIQTALEIQFRGVENLIRSLDDLTWTRARRRR